MATAANASSAVEQPLSRRRILGYAVGSAGTGVFSTVPGLLLLFYLTDVLGVAAATAGLVVVLPKVWDVLVNPFVGATSDRHAIATGRRTRLMLAGAVSLPVAFALVFAGVGTGGGAAVWVTVTFVLAATAYALFQVPYVALPTEMSEQADQRTRVMGWRIVALTVGILIGGALAPVVVTAAGGGITGYRVMGVVVAVVMLAAMLTATLSSRWVTSRPGEEPLALVAAFRTARGNRAFSLLLTAFVVQALAVAVALASIAYVAAFWLGRYGLTSLVFVAFVAPSIVVVPLWVAAGRRWGRWRVLLANSGAFTVAFAGFAVAVGMRSTTAVLAAGFALGICYAGNQVLPLALLTDTVIADAQRTGRRQAGAFTGVWTALETAAFAIGPGVLSLILATTGFASSTFDHPVTQTSTALNGILVGAGVVPAVLFLLSMPFVAAFGRTPAAQVSAEPAVHFDHDRFQS